jgi:hypothetical protein
MAITVPFQAFTLKAGGRLDRIITDITVYPTFDPANPPTPLPAGISTKALWDTGASKSVLSTDLVKSLGLTAVGAANVHHGAGASTSPTYLVNFSLPHKVGISGILATEFPAPHNEFNVLVGMDVICFGDFTVTNQAGKTWVSFRTPSYDAVDYVVEANRAAFAGVGRNDPCPCGGGKKFKKCHGANV